MHRLTDLLDGWNGYQTSLVDAVEPLTAAQLTWRPAAGRRSVGELARHVALGRVTWFARMDPPGLAAVAAAVPEWVTDGDGSRHAIEAALPADDAATLDDWLTRSWTLVQGVLDHWTADDLAGSYRHRFRGTDYLVSRQWTVFRILAHDTHHGGQIAMMLAMQGIEAFELRALGGHIVAPPLAPPAP